MSRAWGRSGQLDDIPVAHTPPGGWREIPPPILGGCTDPIPSHAPELAGWWQVIEVRDEAGQILSEHPALGHRQRNEQCGDRLIVIGNGVIHDMRCDGTLEGAVHDVAEFDKQTEITVIATYEDGRHVLRPVGIPIEVIRWREGEHLMWQYLGFTATMAYLGPADTVPDNLPNT
jgi:hypothetical protein